MPEITVRNWKNETVRTLELDPAVFDYPLKEHLIYEAVLAYQAGGPARARTRPRTASRSPAERGSSGGRRAPAGRAWATTARRCGGTAARCTARSRATTRWSFPKKMRRNALRSALAQKLREGKLVCVEAFELATAQTTRTWSRRWPAGWASTGKTLLVPAEDERNLALAARNNPRLKVVRALGVSVVDLLTHDTLRGLRGRR